MKKPTSQRLVKLYKLKGRRLEIQKAVKALRAMANHAKELESIQAVVSPDTVVVKRHRFSDLGQSAKLLERTRPSFQARFHKASNERPTSRTEEYVDASIAETERAVRTLQRKPSSEVNDFYKRLAKQNA